MWENFKEIIRTDILENLNKLKDSKDIDKELIEELSKKTHNYISWTHLLRIFKDYLNLPNSTLDSIWRYDISEAIIEIHKEFKNDQERVKFYDTIWSFF